MEKATMEQATVREIIGRYEADPGMLIPMMQDLQAERGFLPADDLRALAGELGVPLTRVYGVATFYKAFSLEPRGRHVMQVCMGTACHVRGARRILEELEQHLSIKAGMTTEDRLFTLETVNCLGACALGPIVAVDGEYHGNLTAARVPKLIDAYAKK